MGKLDGRVAFISGAARGQGRSHALRLAEEGADIIAVDICENVASMDYDLATESDLQETEKLVSDLDRRIVTAKADVRDRQAVQAAVTKGIQELGRLDIVCANAGMCILRPWDQVTDDVWNDQVDICLTGVWNVLASTLPALVEGGGGSVICTSSTGGMKGSPFFAPYVAAKWGVRGLVRTLANELAKHKIRINTVIPTGVDTPLLHGMGGLPHLIESDPQLGPLFMNTMPVDTIEPRDVSNAVLWLASDESRYTTGSDVKVDAGCTIR